jgi:hypothetical protein
MIITSEKPMSRNTWAVSAYWIPTTLWSCEKTYVRQKPDRGSLEIVIGELPDFSVKRAAAFALRS